MVSVVLHFPPDVRHDLFVSVLVINININIYIYNRVPYHFYSSSWSRISVLLDDRSTLPFVTNKTNNPTQFRTNKTWPKWPVSHILTRPGQSRQCRRRNCHDSR